MSAHCLSFPHPNSCNFYAIRTRKHQAPHHNNSLTQAAFLPQHNNQGGSAVKNPTAYKTLHESSMEARSSLALVRLFSTKIHKFASNLPCELTTIFTQGWYYVLLVDKGNSYKQFKTPIWTISLTHLPQIFFFISPIDL
jgi:hypothetical protein